MSLPTIADSPAIEFDPAPGDKKGLLFEPITEGRPEGPRGFRGTISASDNRVTSKFFQGENWLGITVPCKCAGSSFDSKRSNGSEPVRMFRASGPMRNWPKSGESITMGKSADEAKGSVDASAVPETQELAPLSAISQETHTRMRVKVSEIKDNPFSLSIFPPKPDLETIESVRRSGVLILPIISRNLVLVDGHRRVHACRLLGIKEIDVEVTSVTDPETIKLMVIDSNRQRRKTWRTRLREAEELKRLLQPLAKENQRTGGKSGGLNCAKGDQVRSQLAKHLGISHETLRRVQLIAEANPSLLDDIDAGDESINSAYRQVVKTMPRLLPARTSKPNLLAAEHCRAAYTLGREIAVRLAFPYPVDGPAYSCLLQGLRDALENKPSPVDITDCQFKLLALAPSLFEGLGKDQSGPVTAAAPATVPVSPYFESDGPEEEPLSTPSTSTFGFPHIRPIPL